MKKRPIIITTTNAITIPKKVRNLLDLQPGDCLDYEVMANGSIILVLARNLNFTVAPANVQTSLPGPKT